VGLAAGFAWGAASLLAGLGLDRGVAGLAGQAAVWGGAGLLYLGVCRLGRVEEVLWAERLLRGRFRAGGNS
jgi:hypothetical protein